jgi:hypothetical protein
MGSLQLAAARYRLGRETAESLCALDEALLSDGQDEAVKLAILDDTSMAEVGPVFEGMCQELGQPIPTLDVAIDLVIAAILSDIVHGSIAPEPALQHLMDDVYEPHVAAETTAREGVYVGESRGLQHLIGAYWGYQELRARPTELSIDGQFGEDAVPLLDEQVRGFANDWLTTRGTNKPG